jgi:hypothetical protein
MGTNHVAVRRVLTAAGLAGFVACAVACGGATTRPEPAAGTAADRPAAAAPEGGKVKTAAELFKPGEVLTVRAPRGRCPLYADQEARQEFWEADGNSAALGKLERDGRFVWLDDGARVRVVKGYGLVVEVEVLDGPHKGRRGLADDRRVGAIERQEGTAPAHDEQK